MYPNDFVSAQVQWSLVIFCLSLSCSKWEGLINKAIAFWFRRDMSLIIIRSSRIVSWMQHRYSILQLFLGDCWLCLWCGWLWITSRTTAGTIRSILIWDQSLYIFCLFSRPLSSFFSFIQAGTLEFILSSIFRHYFFADFDE